MRIVLLLFLCPASALAAPSAMRFQWSKPDLSSRSVCTEVDVDTGGKKFQLVVPDAYCKMPVTYYEWTKPEYGRDSRCEQKDKQTDGAEYLRVADESLCKRPQTIFQWMKADGHSRLLCFSVDLETYGQLFKLRADSRSCPMTLDTNAAFAKPEPFLLEDKPAVTTDKRVKGHLGREYESNPIFWEDLSPEAKK